MVGGMRATYLLGRQVVFVGVLRLAAAKKAPEGGRVAVSGLELSDGGWGKPTSLAYRATRKNRFRKEDVSKSFPALVIRVEPNMYPLPPLVKH